MSSIVPSVVSSDVEVKINMVMCQTNFSKEEAILKLKDANYNTLQVIREYLNEGKKQKEEKIVTINQEIYKQIRGRMGEVMKTYNEKNPINIEHVKENFNYYDKTPE